MNPQLVPLVQLQALDLRGAEIKEQQRRIPDLLSAAERPLNEARRLLSESPAAAEASIKVRRERETELEIQEAHIGKLKARVSEIKKNTEYQAHLFEIQVSDKKKGEIEEQILLLMEEVERHQRGVQEAQAHVASAEKLFDQKKAELESLDAKLATELVGLEQKQREVTQAVDKPLLDRYTKLKSTRKDLAVVPVKDGSCAGCRLQLAPQLVAEVRRSDDLLTCTFCHRILYSEEDTALGTGTPGNPVGQAAGEMPERG